MEDTNELYPVFLKVTQLEVVIIGGGKVGLEKLSFLLKSSPSTVVTIVSKEFHPKIVELSKDHPIKLIQKEYEEIDIINSQVIIAATNDRFLNKKIQKHANEHNILINVADTPDLCDFYMGAIVTKGNIKIAISTNGKSPTIAKRLRQLFEAVIPDDMNVLLENLSEIRSRIKGGFERKVKELNRITEDLIKQPE